jgi:hypothetical protein
MPIGDPARRATFPKAPSHGPSTPSPRGRANRIPAPRGAAKRMGEATTRGWGVSDNCGHPAGCRAGRRPNFSIFLNVPRFASEFKWLIWEVANVTMRVMRRRLSARRRRSRGRRIAPPKGRGSRRPASCYRRPRSRDGPAASQPVQNDSGLSQGLASRPAAGWRRQDDGAGNTG